MADLEAIPGACVTLQDLSVFTDEGKALLQNVGFEIHPCEFVSVIGPSGCGKSTLIKTLAGGHTAKNNLSESGSSGREVGYLPQHSTLHRDLTVREILGFSLDLRTQLTRPRKQQRAGELLEMCGAEFLADQKTESLSGGQLRRVALMELLASDPSVLLLDELTSGLDPHAERELMHLLRHLCSTAGKSVLLVTHSVRNLDLCDRLLMLKQGRLVYDGVPSALLSSSGAVDIEDLYALPLEDHALSPALETDVSSPGHLQILTSRLPLPGVVSQWGTLAQRQWLLFLRDRGQLVLHFVLVFTFPLLVLLFATDGLPLVRSLSLDLLNSNTMESVKNEVGWMESSFRVGSLVSGLAMFQVILLTLMGANNGAREIAKDREINAKEFSAGIRKSSYLAQKIGYVAILSLIQGIWMAFLVSKVCGFPGSLEEKMIILSLVTMAISSLCLAISAGSSSPERASLLSLYLVGFQLPLSGAVLALPETARLISQPFISAFWAWSGYLRSFSDTRYYDVVSQVSNTQIASSTLCSVVLVIHIVAGAVAAHVLLEKQSGH